MKHITHYLQGLTRGFIVHVLIQRCGLMEFRRLYTAHEHDERSKTAAGLLNARCQVRKEVETWRTGEAADRRWIERMTGFK